MTSPIKASHWCRFCTWILFFGKCWVNLLITPPLSLFSKLKFDFERRFIASPCFMLQGGRGGMGFTFGTASRTPWGSLFALGGIRCFWGVSPLVITLGYKFKFHCCFLGVWFPGFYCISYLFGFFYDSGRFPVSQVPMSFMSGKPDSLLWRCPFCGWSCCNGGDWMEPEEFCVGLNLHFVFFSPAKT